MGEYGYPIKVFPVVLISMFNCALVGMSLHNGVMVVTMLEVYS